MAHVWTVEVGGTERKYKYITFQRSLSSNPTKFEAIIEYASDISYWDPVEIKNNSITEWYGYVEKKVARWGEDTRVLKISGRCRKVILWKKWTERFTDTRVNGFFGSVKTAELVKFLIRCPVSDSPLDEVGNPRLNHKIGWGIAPENWTVTANPTTAHTEPEWVKARYMGLAWRNRGTPYNGTTLDVTGVTAGTTPWTKVGASPYIHDAGGEPEDANKIYTKTLNAYDDFSFADLPASATGINNIKLCYYYKTENRGLAWWKKAKWEVYIWCQSDSTWVHVATVESYQPSYRKLELNIKSAISTVSDVNNAKVRFKNVRTELNIHITYCWLAVDYSTGGSQNVGDYFQIRLDDPTEIMGILIESRKSSDQYARNYKIEYRLSDELGNVTDAGGGTGFTSFPADAMVAIGPWTADYDEQFSSIYAYLDFTGVTGTAKAVVYSESAGEPDALIATSNVKTIDGLIGWIKFTFTSPVSLTAGNKYFFAICTSTDLSWGFGQYGGGGNTNKNYDQKNSVACSPPNPFGTRDAEGTGYYLIYAEFDWTELVNVSNNTYRDILHSWKPQLMRRLKITITANDTSHGWEISQIYIYKAEDIKYRVVLDGASPPTGAGYVGGPYLGTISPDANFDTSVENVNIPFGRLIDAINAVTKRLHSGYVPFEWWVDISSGDIHFSNRKGTDKSATISFIRGTHLGGVTKEDDATKSVQRVKIVGKSEGKKQDDISSDWQVDTSAMDTINTFYEEIISNKTVDKKDVADLLANIYVTEHGSPEELITFPVTNDPYEPMAYDIGDDVTCTDTLTGISGSHRIHTIKKTISPDGEMVTLYLDTTYKDVADEWARIHKKLRELALTGTVIEDWFGEGSGQNKMKAEKTTESFEHEAKNDEEEAPADKTDLKWTIDESAANGVNFECGEKWFYFEGTNAGDGVARTVSAYINEPTLNLDQNSKLVCEVKIDTSGAYDPWEDGDEFIIFVGVMGTPWKGFGFTIQKTGGVYQLRARLHDDITERDVLIKNLSENVKYRLEAVCDWEGKVVKYYLLDPNSASDELEFVALLEISEGSNPQGFNMYPLAMHFYTTSSVAGQQAKINIYKFRSEWKAR